MSGQDRDRSRDRKRSRSPPARSPRRSPDVFPTVPYFLSFVCGLTQPKCGCALTLDIADGAPLASPRRTGRAAVSGTKPPPSPPRAGTAPMWLLCGDRTVAAVAVPGDRGCGSCVAQVTEKESVHQILAGCTQKG
eukprot:586640-Rhodomonas_salina.4